MRVVDGRTGRCRAAPRQADPSRRRLLARRLLLALALVALLLAAGAVASAHKPGKGHVQTFAGALDEATRLEGDGEEGFVGYSVAISGDGRLAVVGAPGKLAGGGNAWVFIHAAGGWRLQADLRGSGSSETTCTNEQGEALEECRYGTSVAMSADGGTVVIGSPVDQNGHGAAWIFTRSGESWTEQGPKLAGSEHEHLGRSVALSADGDTALLGASGLPGAVVYARAGGEWSIQGELSGEVGPASHFGRSVALSADGSTALVGAPGDDHQLGSAWVYDREGASWSEGHELTGGSAEQGEGQFGTSVSLSGDGTLALIGASADAGDVGAAWTFTEASGHWTPDAAKLPAPDGAAMARFGQSVSVSADGKHALIGAPGDDEKSGRGWLFARSGGGWVQGGEPLQQPSEPPLVRFGQSVALSGEATSAVVGAFGAGHITGDATAFGSPATNPTVTSISPSEGPTSGATKVTITGTGFLGGATVTIGAPATAVEVVSETEITAETAAGSAGPQEVVVSDARGSSSGGITFTYVAPATGTGTGSNPGSQPAGGGGTGESGVLSSKSSALPAPKLAINGNVTALSGTIRVRLPGSTGFEVLTGTRQVPFGVLIDARQGKVQVTTTAADGKQQSIVFYAGEFVLTQHHNGRVLARLAGGSFAGCPTSRERAHTASVPVHVPPKHVVRKLWANGHGSYTTQGNYATGAVLGTRWLTEDRCDGTLIKVLTDKVAVTDLVNHHRRIVHAGHSFFAKAP